MTDYICKKCHYVGPPKKQKRGSNKIEGVGWMVFPLGLPYTLWRMFTKIKRCRHCDSLAVVKVDSGEGSILLAQTEADLRSVALKPKQPAAAPPPPPPLASEQPKPEPKSRPQDPDAW